MGVQGTKINFPVKNQGQPLREGAKFWKIWACDCGVHVCWMPCRSVVCTASEFTCGYLLGSLLSCHGNIYFMFISLPQILLSQRKDSLHLWLPSLVYNKCQQAFSLKSQRVNISVFVGHRVTFATTPLLLVQRFESSHRQRVNGVHGCDRMKLCSQKQVARCDQWVGPVSGPWHRHTDISISPKKMFLESDAHRNGTRTSR